jgi:hypothetical protein
MSDQGQGMSGNQGHHPRSLLGFRSFQPVSLDGLRMYLHDLCMGWSKPIPQLGPG